MRQPPTKRRPALPRAFFWLRRSRAFRPPVFQTASALPFFTACRAACRVEIARCVCILRVLPAQAAGSQTHPSNESNKQRTPAYALLPKCRLLFSRWRMPQKQPARSIFPFVFTQFAQRLFHPYARAAVCAAGNGQKQQYRKRQNQKERHILCIEFTGHQYRRRSRQA